MNYLYNEKESEWAFTIKINKRKMQFVTSNYKLTKNRNK